MRLGLRSGTALVVALLVVSLVNDTARAGGDVPKWQVDLANTGHYPGETELAPGNVTSAFFGKQFTARVDGQVYAHPLFVERVDVTVGAEPGIHRVVFVATEGDSVYAFDADTGHQLWMAPLLPAGEGNTTVPFQDVISQDLVPQIGVTSTPVIDLATATLYVVAKSKELAGANRAHYVFRLHALDLGSGAEKLGGPAVIADTLIDTTTQQVVQYVSGPTVVGTAIDNVGGVVPFNALRQHQRPALVLAGGRIYFGFGSHGDVPPFHGWLLGYDAATLALVVTFNFSPNASPLTLPGQTEEAAMWSSGASVAIDSNGDLLLATGNGTFDPGVNDWGNTAMRLTPTANGLQIIDTFTPYNQDDLNGSDEDLGSGGLLLLPDAVGSAAHRQLAVVGGKGSTFYLLDRNDLGGYVSGGIGPDRVVQTIPIGAWVYSTPAYFNNQVYLCGDVYGLTNGAQAYSIPDGTGRLTLASSTVFQFSYPCPSASISSNQGADGIVWMLDRATAQLLAFDARNLSTLLYSSDQAAGDRDALPSVVKFTSPTVANGHVYVGTDDSLVAYGLFDHPDLGAGPDLAMPADLAAAPPDLASPPDLAAPPDLLAVVTPPDLAVVTPPDLTVVTPPDLLAVVTPHDLAVVTPHDLTVVTPPDLTVVTPPDLAVVADLAPAPDLVSPATDLASPRDLAAPPDLATTADLAAAGDMGTVDLASTAPVDAAVTEDAGEPPPPATGCRCDAGGRGSPVPGSLLALVAGAFALGRRRRAPRS